MADNMRDAGIRVTLKKDGFVVAYKGLEQEVKAGGERMGVSLGNSLKGGLKGAESAVKGLFSSVKSGLSQLAGFGGVAGTTEMIREGLKTEGVFKSIAFQIRAGTGELVNHKSLMDAASQSAQRWGKDVDELGAAMRGIYEETGNADFAKSSIETIATTARATKQPISELGELTGVLNEKFGITAETLGDTLASVYSLGNRGGVTVGELGGKLGIIGAVAREAGLQGAQGFGKMVGLLNVADDGGKNLRKNIGAVHQVLETLTTSASRNKAFMQLGIDPSQAKGDVTKQIGAILKATGGSKDKLAVAFQGEGLAFLVSLGQQYAASFSETKGTVKQKTDAALAAYEGALQKASKSQLSYADIQKEATARMNGGQAKMDAAIEKMKASFLREDIAKAVGKLADVLPKFADLVSNLVGFASEHPALAAGGAIAGTAAKGFAGGAVAGVGGPGAILKAIVTWGAPGAAAAAPGAAAAAAAPAAAAAAAVSSIAKFRSAIDTGIGPLGKLGIAAVAASAALLAIDQASKLNDELGESGWSDMWKKLKNDIGVTTDEEYQSELGILKNGNDAQTSGGPDVFTEWDADQRQRQVDFANSDAGKEDAKNKAMRSFISTDSDDGRLPFEAAQDARAAQGKGGKGQGAPPPVDHGAVAKAIANEELRVRIMNPEAIRGGGGFLGGGGPGPGYADRE